MILIPFLHELDELRSMVAIYLGARRTAGRDPSRARVIAMYHIYVGEIPRKPAPPLNRRWRRIMRQPPKPGT